MILRVECETPTLHMAPFRPIIAANDSPYTAPQLAPELRGAKLTIQTPLSSIMARNGVFRNGVELHMISPTSYGNPVQRTNPPDDSLAHDNFGYGFAISGFLLGAHPR